MAHENAVSPPNLTGAATSGGAVLLRPAPTYSPGAVAGACRPFVAGSCPHAASRTPRTVPHPVLPRVLWRRIPSSPFPDARSLRRFAHPVRVGKFLFCSEATKSIFGNRRFTCRYPFATWRIYWDCSMRS